MTLFPTLAVLLLCCIGISKSVLDFFGPLVPPDPKDLGMKDD